MWKELDVGCKVLELISECEWMWINKRIKGECWDDQASVVIHLLMKEPKRTE